VGGGAGGLGFAGGAEGGEDFDVFDYVVWFFFEDFLFFFGEFDGFAVEGGEFAEGFEGGGWGGGDVS